MWDTNRVKAERKIHCDDDCVQSGCPGHTVELVVHSTAGVGAYIKDGQTKAIFDRDEAEALLSMLNEIKES